MLSQQARVVLSLCLLLSATNVDAGGGDLGKSSLLHALALQTKAPAAQTTSLAGSSLLLHGLQSYGDVKLAITKLNTSVSTPAFAHSTDLLSQWRSGISHHTNNSTQVMLPSADLLNNWRSGISLHAKNSTQVLVPSIDLVNHWREDISLHARKVQQMPNVSAPGAVHRKNILQKTHRRLTAPLKMTSWGQKQEQNISVPEMVPNESAPRAALVANLSQPVHKRLTTSLKLTPWGQNEVKNATATEIVPSATAPERLPKKRLTTALELKPWGQIQNEDQPADRASPLSDAAQLRMAGQQPLSDTRILAAVVLSILAIFLILDIVGIFSFHRLLSCALRTRASKEVDSEAILAGVYERAAQARKLKAMNPPIARCR